jgi:hypothetical protein
LIPEQGDDESLLQFPHQFSLIVPSRATSLCGTK